MCVIFWSNCCPFCVKNRSNFLVFLLFLKISFSLQKKKEKGPTSCVQNWSNHVVQHTWSLDQFLTQPWTSFNTFFCQFCLLAETTVSIGFSAKMQILKTRHKRKHAICEHTCANCSCQNVCFFLIIHFWGVRNFQNLERFFDSSPNSRNTRCQRKTNPKTTRKQDAIKRKSNHVIYQTKQDNKQNNKGTS